MEGEDAASYYAVLNVSPDASDGEIRRAYRQLAQVFHPDKHASEELRQKAAQGFAVINGAYEVLSNPARRQVYDIYGKEGLAAGLDVGTKLKSVEELKAEWEKFRARKGSETDDTAYHSVLHCEVDFSRALATPISDGWGPEMQTCWVQSTVSQAIGHNLVAWMGGNMITNGDGRGGGSLICGMKSNLSSQSNIEANASWGAKSMIAISSNQQITKNSFGTVTGSWSGNEGPGLQFSTSRNISGDTRGSVGIALGPPSELGANLTVSTRPNSKSSLSGKIQVGPIYSIAGKGSYAVTESTTARAAAKFGLSGIELDLGVVKQVASDTTISMAVVVGLQGTIVRVKWNREGFQLDLPVILSRDIRDWKIAIAAYTVPPLVISILRYLVVKPLMRRYQDRVSLQMRKEHAEAIRKQLEAAMVSQSLITPVAQRLTREAAEKGGLVIVQGEYGASSAPKHHMHAIEGLPSSITSEIPPPSIDVTVAIQYLVSDNKLKLHSGVGKSGLMGFCDPCPGQKKTLRIFYVWRGQPYQVEVGEDDGLNLPGDGSLVSDLEDARRVIAQSRELGLAQNGEPSNSAIRSSGPGLLYQTNS